MGDVLTDFSSLLAQPTSPYFTVPMWQDFLIQKEGKGGGSEKETPCTRDGALCSERPLPVCPSAEGGHPAPSEQLRGQGAAQDSDLTATGHRPQGTNPGSLAEGREPG